MPRKKSLTLKDINKREFTVSEFKQKNQSYLKILIWDNEYPVGDFIILDKKSGFKLCNLIKEIFHQK